MSQFLFVKHFYFPIFYTLYRPRPYCRFFSLQKDLDTFDTFHELSELLKKTGSVNVKDKIRSVFKTNTTEKCSKPRINKENRNKITEQTSKNR